MHLHALALAIMAAACKCLHARMHLRIRICLHALAYHCMEFMQLSSSLQALALEDQVAYMVDTLHATEVSCA